MQRATFVDDDPSLIVCFRHVASAYAVAKRYAVGAESILEGSKHGPAPGIRRTSVVDSCTDKPNVKPTVRERSRRRGVQLGSNRKGESMDGDGKPVRKMPTVRQEHGIGAVAFAEAKGR